MIPNWNFAMRAEVQTTPQLVADPESMHFGLLAGEEISNPHPFEYWKRRTEYQAYVSASPTGIVNSSLWAITIVMDKRRDKRTSSTAMS